MDEVDYIPDQDAEERDNAEAARRVTEVKASGATELDLSDLKQISNLSPLTGVNHLKLICNS